MIRVATRLTPPARLAHRAPPHGATSHSAVCYTSAEVAQCSSDPSLDPRLCVCLIPHHAWLAEGTSIGYSRRRRTRRPWRRTRRWKPGALAVLNKCHRAAHGLHTLAGPATSVATPSSPPARPTPNAYIAAAITAAAIPAADARYHGPPARRGRVTQPLISITPHPPLTYPAHRRASAPPLLPTAHAHYAAHVFPTHSCLPVHPPVVTPTLILPTMWPPPSVRSLLR